MSWAKASDPSLERIYLDMMVDSLHGAQTFGQWIAQLPFPPESKTHLQNWFAKKKWLEVGLGRVQYDRAKLTVSYQSTKEDSSAVQWTLVQLKPLIYQLDGKKIKVPQKFPTLDLLFQTIPRAQGEEEASWRWHWMFPSAEAKISMGGNSSFLMMLLGGIGIVSAGSTVWGIFKQYKSVTKSYEQQEKEIAGPLQQLGVSQSNRNYPYRLTDVDCLKVEGEGRINPLAKVGESGHATYNLNKIRLTPKGKAFGDSDLVIDYTGYGKEKKIKSIQLSQTVASSTPKTATEKNCFLYIEDSKVKEKPFDKSCSERVFPGQNFGSLDDFYKALGIFNLKQYESLGDTMPGCEKLIQWAVNGYSPPSSPSPSQKTQSPADTKKTINSQTQ